MLKYKTTIWALALAGLVACEAPPEEDLAAFDSEENDGDIGLSKADGTAKAGYQPGCDAPASPSYALGGTLLRASGAPAAGYVVVKDEKIVSVVATKAEVPAGTPIVETGGIISPGLMDLHNHIAYNFIPVWNSGKRFSNRYQWARLSAYGPAIKNPYNAVKAKNQCQAIKYGELRAIVGGTTTIQGSVDLACARSLVRNVEFVNFCEDHIRQNVLPINGIDQTDAAGLNKQFASGATRAFLVHLAEGIDDSSRNEFEQLRQRDLLKPQVVGIHSTALTEAQINEMGKIGMKIVWSPLSNLMLYGKTTNIPAALKAGVTVALAPDWSPSGSANLLGELKVADRVNKTLFGGVITDQQLWQMATTNPARIAGMEDRLGDLAPGRYADLMVVRPVQGAATPYRAIIDARPQDVVLTVVSGQPYYGTTSILDSLGQSGKYSPIDACGEARGLRVATNDARIPGSSETVADLTSAFTAVGVKDIIPLFQCDAAPEWAFANISK